MLKKIKCVCKNIFEQIQKNEIFPQANQLTYKLIFSLFPFLIFLISLIGFFDIGIDMEDILGEIYEIFPYEISQLIDTAITEISIPSAGIMSVSVLTYIVIVGNCFRVVTLAIRRIYDTQTKQNFIAQMVFGTLLTLALAAGIIVSFLIFVYGDTLYAWLITNFGSNLLFELFFGFAGAAIATFLVLFAVVLVYKIAIPAEKLANLLPGAVFTIWGWAIATFGFNIYISSFANYSLVYGSIASIFITMLWLNIVSITILLGAQLNQFVRK